MKNLLVLTILLVLSFSLSVNAQKKAKKPVAEWIITTNAKANTDKKAEVKEEKPFNKVCPVSGEDLDKDMKTYTYNGKVYGLCCNKCLTKFKKDPAKYAARLNEDGTKYKK